MKWLLLASLLMISRSAVGFELNITRLSDCESLDNWSAGGDVRLTEGVHKGKSAIAAEVPSGKVGGIRLNHANTGVDLSKAHTLAFWWKSEGKGLRSFMIKIRNYPIAGGMEAVYRVWDTSLGQCPRDWQRASIVLSKPVYDDWGGKPDQKSRYISFRTTTSPDADVRLFIDEVAALPPIFDWQVSDSVLRGDKLALTARNLTDQELSLSFGSGEQILNKIDLPPKDKLSFDLALSALASQLSQLQPFGSIPLQLWAQVADMEETRMDETVNVVKKADLPQHPRLLFNQEGIEELKERIDNYDWAKARWDGVKRSADRMLDEPVELPPRGGNWWHWYACPEHGAGLRTGNKIGEWQWEHICPVDNEVFRGDPSQPNRDYDGCVISGSHGRLARSILELGMTYQLTGDSRYAEKAREILLAYAHQYLSYPLHTTRGEERIGGGRVGPQTLDESTWLIPVCQGADLIWDKLSEDDKDIIARKMMLPAAKDVILRHRIGVHNIQCWKNSAVGLVGFLLGNDELISEAIHNPERGYWTQMHKGVLPDGIWWEGAWGYHFYTLSALWGLTEAAGNCGIDLYCPELKSMFDGPLSFAMPDLRLPAFNDSGEVALKGRASIYELAYARYSDPRYATLISTSNRRNDFALRFGVGELPTESAAPWESVNYPNSGYAILARGEGEQATWLCMKYGPHGGGHGHPDKLNFVLYSGGRLIAPDPGTARYGVPIQRGWYRTTLAHNTLVVDEASQGSAEGKYLAFGSQDGVDYVVAEAGNIYDGVRFTRSAALVDKKLVVFVDQIRCDRERLLDVVYHNRGAWDILPDGSDWTPPDKPGYEYLRDAVVRETQERVKLFVRSEEDQRTGISLAASEPTQVITATGVEKHAEDRVPMVIFRRRAKETTFVWCVALDGEEARLEHLPVRDSDGNILSPASATAIQVEIADGRKRILAVNPDKLSLSVKLADGADQQFGEIFGVK